MFMSIFELCIAPQTPLHSSPSLVVVSVSCSDCTPTSGTLWLTFWLTELWSLNSSLSSKMKLAGYALGCQVAGGMAQKDRFICELLPV